MEFTKWRARVAGLGLAASIVASTASAQESKFYIQAGVGHVALSDTFEDFTLGGAPAPTADASVTDPTTLIINGGYMLSENWSASFTAGIPVESTATGLGSLAGVGELGSITFGVAGLHLNRHFNTSGKFQPFLGAGLAYGIIFDTKDAGLTDVKVDNSLGLEIKAGFDYMFNDRYGAYFSVSKAYLGFDIEGTATTPGGAVPATVKAKLDPVLIQSGLTIRF